MTTTDRHTDTPKSVRMPGGLKDWYKAYAAAHATTPNAAMVRALQEFRERIEGGRDE